MVSLLDDVLCTGLFQLVVMNLVEGASQDCDFGAALHQEAREFNRALALHSDYDECRVNLGLVYIKMERWDDARREFKTAVQSTPDNAEAQFNLGFVYLEHDKDASKAEEHLRKAILTYGKLAESASTLNNTVMVNFRWPRCRRFPRR